MAKVSNPMQLRLELQLNPVADEVSAITAVVRPIIKSLLYSLKSDVVSEVGGYENIKLKMLPRLYRPGDRDCGLCFEYAVHDALSTENQSVVERVNDALSKYCNINGNNPTSLLFGAEKSGALNLINTAKDRLTDESSLLYGTRGRPAKLKHHIDSIAAAFRRKEVREALPWSISGTWKCDLFVGYTDIDRWVETTVKINPTHLEGARGLRIGIVPARQGLSDSLRLDSKRNLVICPLPHDGDFMEVFYQGWVVVQQFLASDAKLPKEVYLPRQAERQVARFLEERREFPIVDVLEAIYPLSQPELLDTKEQEVDAINTRETTEIETDTIIAPIARSV